MVRIIVSFLIYILYQFAFKNTILILNAKWYYYLFVSMLFRDPVSIRCLEQSFLYSINRSFNHPWSVSVSTFYPH